MDNSIKNHKVLKEIGLDEWFMYSEKLQPFFGWFGANINDANTFSETDLRDYGDLKDENLVLNDMELEREAKRYQNDLNIIRDGKREIQQLLAELEFASCVEKSMDELTSDIKKTNVAIQQKLDSTHLIAKRLKSEEESLLEECMHRSMVVQDIQQENMGKLKEVYRFYVNDHLSPVFIHQMGMNQSYQHCDSFIKHLELFMENNFKLEDPSDLDFSDETAHEQSLADLDQVEKKLFMSSMELSQNQMQLAAQKSLNAAFKLDWKLLSMTEIDKEAIEMDRQNEDYFKVQSDAALNSLKLVLRQLASLEVETAAFENTRAKLDRAKERYAQMKAIYSVVSEDLLIAELLWLLMQFDMEMLRQRSQRNILDQYQTENRSAMRRIEIMRQCCRTASEPIIEMYSLPMNLLAHLNEPDESSPVGLFAKFLRAVSDNLIDLGNMKSARFVMQSIEDIRGQETRLRKFVQNGPVTNIVLCEIEMQNALFTIKSTMKQIEQRLADFKSNYIKNYTEPMNNNRFWQYKQLLWIWFLTEPKTVIKALKTIQVAAKEAASRGISRPLKTLSGIRRRE